ncbi:hypothetical protein E2C01_032208 [Portunus trituberculatus]|uniref:Uncharacterized protein n=1 Tax=Portunus trituberculatus TaxID=210409 RepID=A0A5B7EZZ8_PORTR|nr:hypothetical protein [Portunus trituberculatus]
MRLGGDMGPNMGTTINKLSERDAKEKPGNKDTWRDVFIRIVPPQPHKYFKKNTHLLSNKSEPQNYVQKLSFISGENKESNESASVSELEPSTSGFTGITPGEVTKMFSWMVTHPPTASRLPTLPTLLPSSSKLSITSLHLWYVQIKMIK